MNNAKFLMLAVLAVACASQTHLYGWNYGNVANAVDVAGKSVAQDVNKISPRASDVAAGEIQYPESSVKRPAVRPAKVDEPEPGYSYANYGEE